MAGSRKPVQTKRKNSYKSGLPMTTERTGTHLAQLPENTPVLVTSAAENVRTDAQALNHKPADRKIRTVCVIDDNKMDGWIVERSIKRLAPETEVLLFTDARQALQYLVHTNRQPDVILLDLFMPDMSGWQFLEEYLKVFPDSYPAVDLFIFTSSIDQNDKKRARSIHQVRDYLSKPLTKLDLLDKIKIGTPE
jgi:CheY-like chemotaxis protein